MAPDAPQVVQFGGRLNFLQPFRRNEVELPRASTPGRRAVDPVKNILRPLVGKIRNHSSILPLLDGDGKRMAFLFINRGVILQRCSG